MLPLPPAIAVPLASARDNVTVPAALAMRAIPVLEAPPTETGTDTDLEVTVVAPFADAVNAGCRYRADTVTFPLENTFANPAVRSPLLCVLIVTKRPAVPEMECLVA